MTLASANCFCFFLFQLYEKSGCYGSVKLPLTYSRKIGNGHLLFVTADISTKVLQKCFWSSPRPFPIMQILFESLILIATEMLNFSSPEPKAHR